MNKIKLARNGKWQTEINSNLKFPPYYLCGHFER